jgi:hypothetical protein
MARTIAVVIWWSLLTLTARAQSLSPDDAVARMTVAAGFEVSVVAAEPMVRQPVAMEFDDRGRLWVIQYLQYPNPNGLKRVLSPRRKVRAAPTGSRFSKTPMAMGAWTANATSSAD